MKSFCAITAAAVASLAAPVSGEEILVTGGGAPILEVVNGQPAQAVLNLGPIYPVFMNQVPAGVKQARPGRDVSGKGMVYTARIIQTDYHDGRVCWREVRRVLVGQACGQIDSSSASVSIRVGSLRNATFVLYPVLFDRQGRYVSWVRNPENARYQLRCRGRSDMVVGFHVDGQGHITLATKEQMAAYESANCPSR